MLRPPRWRDYPAWARLRRTSRSFLTPWEPAWKEGHLTFASYWIRVRLSRRSIRNNEAFPFFIFKRASGELIGSVVLENIRGGPARACSLGYWVGRDHASRGFMSEAIPAVVNFAFDADISRVEAACLPDNMPSRRVLEKSGFTCEGIAGGYLQIAGRWRDHALYAKMRSDRTDSHTEGS
ncbi:MAG: GNAT family protein [Rhodobacteraceae bacterium]|nr:GNAT family protein [Paracoccaceae bacterium]